MPISATFQADFTVFNTAVQVAQTQLKNFDDNSKKVTASLTAMENSISGVAIVQAATVAAEAVDRLGGVTKLTYDELQRLGTTAQQAVDKLRALGQEVPTNIQSLADRARGASEEMLRLAGATKQNESATTDWGRALSTAQGVLGAFGIQTGLAALVNFGKSILDDADALMKMHDKTGISVEGLQALRIAGDDAGVSLEDMTSAVTMLQKRLGGDDASALKALQDLGIEIGKFKQLDGAEQMAAISDAVRDLHDPLRVATDLSGLFGKAWAEQLPALKRGFEELKDGTGQMSAFAVKLWDDIGDHMKATSRSWTAAIGEMTAKVLDNSLTGGLLALNAQLDAMKAKAEKAAPALGGLVPPGLPSDLDDIIAKSDAWAKESKTVADAMVELNSVGTGWQGTLETINGDVVEAIKYYLAAGVSQKALGDAFGLSAPQVKAVESAMKDYGETVKAVQKIETDKNTKSEEGLLGLSKLQQETSQKYFEAQSRGYDEIGKAQAALDDQIAKSTLSATDYQIAKINERAAAEIKAFKGTADQLAQYSKIVMDTAAREADAVINSASKALDVVATKATTALGLIDLAARQAKANLPVDVVGNAAAAGVSGVGMQGPIYVAPPIFSRDSGGPATAGQSYLIGTGAQPELFTPSTNGVFTPNSRSAGVVQNIVIHVNGTAADVARQVSNEIMRAAMRGQQFGAS